MKHGEHHTRSLMKAMTWRVTASADTFVISWFVTGRLTLAVPIALGEIVTKVGWYYLHERAWATVSYGKCTRD